MDVATTAAALLVMVLGVLPGVPADRVYRALAGVSWREKDIAHFGRLLAFSIFGVVIYSLVAVYVAWPEPDHLRPETFSGRSVPSKSISDLSIGYLGHVIGAVTVALFAAGTNWLLDLLNPVSASRDAWDHFVRCSVPKHWVLVTLQNGDCYAGILDHADVSTEPEHRDIVLSEPYKYVAEDGKYAPTYQQYLFLRGSDVSSIAVVYNSEADKRLVPADKSPFLEGSNELAQTNTPTPTAAASHGVS